MVLTKEEKLLKKHSEHLRYEWQMFMMSFDIPYENDQNKENIVTEIFCLHTRNLIDFFYKSKKSNPDDMLALDYVKNEKKWLRARGIKPNYLKKAKKRIDKELAHMTYKRICGKPKRKLWERGRIKKKMERLFVEFLSNCRDELLCPHMIKLRRYCLENDKTALKS